MNDFSFKTPPDDNITQRESALFSQSRAGFTCEIMLHCCVKFQNLKEKTTILQRLVPLLPLPFCCERLFQLLPNYLFASLIKNKTQLVCDTMPASRSVCIVQEYDPNITLF